MSLLTIDVGTTGCKVVAFNEEGQIIAQSYGEYSLIHINPGWSELDSQLVWQKVSDGIREVVSQTKNDPIEAISVASQGEAVTPIDKNGQIAIDFGVRGIPEKIIIDSKGKIIHRIIGPSTKPSLEKILDQLTTEILKNN